jgi:hypothetical protein
LFVFVVLVNLSPVQYTRRNEDPAVMGISSVIVNNLANAIEKFGEGLLFTLHL